jgi:hypothetical protein
VQSSNRLLLTCVCARAGCVCVTTVKDEQALNGVLRIPFNRDSKYSCIMFRFKRA